MMRSIDGHPKPSDSEATAAEPTEKNQYTACYNRLYPLLKGGQLDFPLLAEKTGFKERRIREMLQFRLGSGEVRHLFGLREHVCYLCDQPVPIPKEPICLPCLEGIDALSRGDTFTPAYRTSRAGDATASPLPVLPEPEHLSPLKDETSDDDDEDEPFFLEGDTLLPPRRYGFERARPSRR